MPKVECGNRECRYWRYMECLRGTVRLDRDGTCFDSEPLEKGERNDD